LSCEDRGIARQKKAKHDSDQQQELEVIRTDINRMNILPPSQNVRRLSFSQKSTFSKFDQVYMKKYEYL
jgi:hypothetical protein